MDAHPLRDPFLRRAEERPDEVWAHGGGTPVARRTRGASVAIAARAAAALRERALAPGTLVALLAPPGPALVEGLLALWEAGLVAVLVDPATTPDEARRLEERIGIAWRWALSGGWAEELGALRPSGVPEEGIAAASGGAAPGAAVLKLTSGSTGAPRGIAVTARALAADGTVLADAMGLTPADRLLVSVPPTHSYGFSVLVAPALTRGAVLAFPGELDALAAAGALGATFLPSVPAWFQAVLRLPGKEPLPPGLRLLLSAGAPLSPDLARAFRERHGLPLHALYGASEAGGITWADGRATERGSVGRALPGVELELLAGADGPGVVAVRSPAVARGYVPAEPGDERRLAGGRYVSEDLARLEDGDLFLVGRTSAWINVKGRKVDPREVEEVVRALEGVREVAVVGAPTGGGEELVRAVVACASGALSAADVLAWCAPRLAPHKRPRSVLLVDTLPRTPRGKLDRARLTAPVPTEARA